MPIACLCSLSPCGFSPALSIISLPFLAMNQSNHISFISSPLLTFFAALYKAFTDLLIASFLLATASRLSALMLLSSSAVNHPCARISAACPSASTSFIALCPSSPFIFQVIAVYDFCASTTSVGALTSVLLLIFPFTFLRSGFVNFTSFLICPLLPTCALIASYSLAASSPLFLPFIFI